MTTLDQLHSGQIAIIVSLEGDSALVQRLYELGMLEGETIEMVGRAPLGDPLEVRVGNTRLSLRATEASVVTIRTL